MSRVIYVRGTKRVPGKQGLSKDHARQLSRNARLNFIG